MKKITASLAVIILLTACKKDSLPEPAPDKPLKDIDGNGYDTVKIGTQFWMKQNLSTSHYRNGDPIPEITSDAVWFTLTTGAWCWYNNDSVTYASTYGKLYNWYAVNDPRGLAPAGYHIPAEAEWTNLANFLGGPSIAGDKMKETGSIHWQAPNDHATNSSRFTGLPAGFRVLTTSFTQIRRIGCWWSSTGISGGARCGRMDFLSFSSFVNSIQGKYDGLSVRCLRD